MDEWLRADTVIMDKKTLTALKESSASFEKMENLAKLNASTHAFNAARQRGDWLEAKSHSLEMSRLCNLLRLCEVERQIT